LFIKEIVSFFLSEFSIREDLKLKSCAFAVTSVSLTSWRCKTVIGCCCRSRLSRMRSSIRPTGVKGFVGRYVCILFVSVKRTVFA